MKLEQQKLPNLDNRVNKLKQKKTKQLVETESAVGKKKKSSRVLGTCRENKKRSSICIIRSSKQRVRLKVYLKA